MKINQTYIFVIRYDIMRQYCIQLDVPMTEFFLYLLV